VSDDTEVRVDDDLADLIDDCMPPVRKGRPLPANIIRRPIQLPPMVQVKDA